MTAMTVYKTNRPDVPALRSAPEDFDDVEYYEIAFGKVDNEIGERKPTLKVFHGWWDERTKEAKNSHLLLEASYGSWEEAESAYHSQISYYAGQGFIYSFTPTPQGPYQNTIPAV
jgi:hypothetical protein